MYKEIMQKSDNLQLHIQWAIYNAQEILVALLALSKQRKSSVESPALPLEEGISTEPSRVSLTTISGKASPTFGHTNANFSVFIDRIRTNF